MQYVVKFEQFKKGSFDPDFQEITVRGTAEFYDDLNNAQAFVSLLQSAGIQAELKVKFFDGSKTILIGYEELKRMALSMLDHETAPATTGLARAPINRKLTVDEKAARFRGDMPQVMNGPHPPADYDDRPGEYEDHADH